jgi:hypothetical protein
MAPNFFLNDAGQVAFQAVNSFAVIGFGSISFTSPTNSTWVNSAPICGTIYVWSPSGLLTKVAAAGDSVPNSSAKFSCVGLNSGPPSPLNHSGALTFFSNAPLLSSLGCTFCGIPSGNQAVGVDGTFLYHPGGSFTEIAAANDTLPGQTLATSFVPYLAIPLNSSGQVAFGAQLGTTSQAFYLENGTSVQSVMALGDSVPGGSDTFGFPHFISGLADNGNLAFTAATSSVIDGLFLAPAGGPIQTLALQGGAAPNPVGGMYSLPILASGSITVSGSPPVTIYSFRNFAQVNIESDVAFASGITGGSADSGYFRMLQAGPSAGTLQPVVVQGQAAPGGGTFSTIPTISTTGGIFALGPDGSLAFVSPFSTTSGTSLGMFVARPDGTLLKVAATGDILPGGGVLSGISMSPKLSAGNAGTFAFLAGIFGGSSQRAIFATAIPPGTAGTTTTLNQVVAPAVAQQPVMLSAVVTSSTASGSPSGTVTFFANGIALGAGALNSAGQASMNTSLMGAGQNSIVAQYGGDANFAAGNSNPLTIVVAGFAPLPASLVVTRGQNLVIPMIVYGPTTPAMSFALSCSGLPANATCMFDNNPVTPSLNGTTVHLTITTMAGAKQPLGSLRKGFPSLLDYELSAVLTSLFAAILFWLRAPRWRLVPCACLAAFALALVVGGCGAAGSGSYNSVSPGTPAGATTFTVTGTSGSTTISTVVKVTVLP